MTHSHPVFHPDHPHNRHPHAYHQPSSSSSSSAHRSRNRGSIMPSQSLSYAGTPGVEEGEGVSDSESSLSPSPGSRGRCFCGRPTESGGIYCSVDCARSDAFSSLCYKPTPSPHTSLSLADTEPTVAAISAALSRDSSAASSTTSASSSHEPESTDWNASHYRRLARADMRKEERREERRRRRAEGSMASSISRSTMMSTSSSASRAVPDLIGGGGAAHSRNPSIASSITSLSSSTWGASSLSRNPSSASTASRRGYGNNINVDTAIMEDDDEEEWLQSEVTRPYVPAMPLKKPQPVRRPSRSQSSSSSGRKGKKGTPEPPFGMGKDMRDVLEEIIQMEKSFLVSDNENDVDDDATMIPPAGPGLFTSQFDRPPRTPSPTSGPTNKRKSIAPGAPMRGHRSAASQPNIHAEPACHPAPGPAVPASQRPPSLIALHQSSLSESHTALYLATASPVAPGRRSASPKLEMRKSLTFTPEAAGPSISFDGLPLPRYMHDPVSSPSMNITPMGRRRNITPSAKHPTMDNWRFPSPANRGSASTMATPTKHSQATFPYPNQDPYAGTNEQIEPALLWPAPPPNLQPSLFPCSPATGTPEFEPTTTFPRSDSEGMMSNGSNSPEVPAGSRLSAPGSGFRLGCLLGSGDEGMEVDDGESTAHGHSSGSGDEMDQANRGRAGFLPVFLEAEGFRAIDGTRRGW